ncbi:MAG: BatA domain-containing protein [Micavibrio sp.]
MIQPLKTIFKLAAGAGFVAATPSAAMASVGMTAAGLALGPVTFAAPWVLLGLASLPPLWWLMKSIPPKPVLHAFPAMSILFNLNSEDQAPARMPLWQRLLRLTAAGMVITGLAQPQLNSDLPLEGNGPVMLVVDNGWASARSWSARTEEMKVIIDNVERDGRMIIVLPTAAPADGSAIKPSAPMTPAEARRVLLEMQPLPWPADRQAALDAVQSLELKEATAVIWLSNGLNDPGALALAERLQNFGQLTVLQDEATKGPRLLVPPDPTADTLSITVRRADGTHEDKLTLIASDESGRKVDQAEAQFKAGETETKAVFNLSRDARNQLTRITIDGENSAGAVVLLDERWRRRPVGLIEAGRTDSSQALLNESNYVDRALDPYVDLRHGGVDDLLKNQLAVMILTDSVILNDAARNRIEEWVQQGGTLLRFAGPNLALSDGKDDLLAVPLRPGSRGLNGGARVAPFEEGSPFHGIKAPDDVTVDREVLAQPGPELDERVWARLEDGTPLVSAKREGKGWIVLVHTTANTDWSNLALSGAFVDMMRAVVSHSHGVANDMSGPDFSLPPLKTLDGHGQLVSPPATVGPLNKLAVETGSVGPKNPPGFYGNESIRHAHNLSSAVPEMKPLPAMPEGVSRGEYAVGKDGDDLSGPLLAGAMSLLLLDLLVLMGQRGMLPRVRRTPQGPAPKNS